TVSLTGAKPEEIPGVLAQYHFPSLEEQASATWLGGGAAKALLDTSRFLKAQKKIDLVKDDYGVYVNDTVVKSLLNTP
ncbi:MAG: taurine ABC transporter substrate-binding protein, partial [Myxococcota bacterium]